MSNYLNKEKTQLLQLSESISDVELPEIIIQNKRKKRRKTLPKPSNTKHSQSKFRLWSSKVIIWICIISVILTLYLFFAINAEIKRLRDELNKGGKKIKKRRELDALIAHSIAKRGQIKTQNSTNGNNSQDKLLSVSTDDQEEYVWPAPAVVRNSSKCRKKNYTFLHMCGPLLFLCLSILIVLMYWLYFDLRQQLYDYRQKVEEVSTTSQNLPDTLQKWHETSTFLSKNQSIIYAKIDDLSKNVENLNANFSAYKEAMKNKQDLIEDQKVVANFGAKIEAVATDIDEIKERFSFLVKNQNNMKIDFEKLRSNFTEIVNLASGVGGIPSNYSLELKSLKSFIVNEIKMAAFNLSIVNDTLSQKSSILREELQNHKANIDELLDRSANMTSHVTSIEDSWTKYRQKIVDLNMMTKRIEENIWELKNKSTAIAQSIQNISIICQNLNNEYRNNNENKNQSTPYRLDQNSPTDGNWSKAFGSESIVKKLPIDQQPIVAN